MSFTVSNDDPDKELEYFWGIFKSTLISVSYKLSLCGFLDDLSPMAHVKDQVEDISQFLNSCKSKHEYTVISKTIVHVYNSLAKCLLTMCGIVSKQYGTNGAEECMHVKSSIGHVLGFSKRWKQWKCFKISGHFISHLTSVNLLTIVNASFGIEDIHDRNNIRVLTMSYMGARNVETLIGIFDIGVRSCKSVVIDNVSKIAASDNLGSQLTEYVMKTYNVKYSVTTKGCKLVRLLA